MDELTNGIRFTRNVPQNIWDFGKYMEMCVHRHQEALKRLENFKQEGETMEHKLTSRGVPEHELENFKFGRTNEYIQLLERVIQCKKEIEWLKRGHRQLIYDKIHLLESMI